MQYELTSLRPSQERRLPAEVKTPSGRETFARKLRNFLKKPMRNDEASRDFTTTLAIRLSSLGIWDELQGTEIRSVLNGADKHRRLAFLEGVPADIVSGKVKKKSDASGYNFQSSGGKSHLILSSGRRGELIEKYANDLIMKCGVDPDMELLERVTISCGPSIYKPNSALVAASNKRELDTIKRNFLIKRLKLEDGPWLEEGISEAINRYGRSQKHKHRAVVYYLLVDHFASNAPSPQLVTDLLPDLPLS